MAQQITAKQSRQARSLLKWNIQDVVNKCGMRTQRLDHFERGIARLTRPENDDLIKVYSEHGIIFTSDYEVMLKKVDVAKQRSKINPEEQDILEDLDQLRQLEYDVKQKEKEKAAINADEEAAKDFSERVKHLVNLKENQDEAGKP